MKNKILPLTVALCLFAHFAFAQALIAQNSTISFDLTQLPSGVHSGTITASDGSTTLTVSARTNTDSAMNLVTVPNGLRLFTTRNQFKIIFSFNVPVVLESYFIGDASRTFNGNESLTLRLNSTDYDENFPVDNRNLNNQTLTFNNKLTIPADTSLELITINPNELMNTVYWKTLTVTIVPEPATYALYLAAFALVFVALRRRR